MFCINFLCNSFLVFFFFFNSFSLRFPSAVQPRKLKNNNAIRKYGKDWFERECGICEGARNIATQKKIVPSPLEGGWKEKKKITRKIHSLIKFVWFIVHRFSLNKKRVIWKSQKLKEMEKGFNRFPSSPLLSFTHSKHWKVISIDRKIPQLWVHYPEWTLAPVLSSEYN